MITTALLLLFTSSTVYSQLVANDVGNDYAQVKELLGQFYRRSARNFGHDYDPLTLAKAAENMKDDGTEATPNRKVWSELFENDILLTLPQAERLLAEKSSFGRGKRQAQPTASSFWKTKTISYEFAVADSTWQNLIRSGLRHIEYNTCIRFRENGGDADRLRYFMGSGCYSNVGRIGGTQSVSIGRGCENLGIVSHETLHALGLWHEQSRTDRDTYVYMNSNYIIRGTEGNFEKRSAANSDNMDQPYDMGSVMHYGPKSFTTSWDYDTILTRDTNYQHTIGQRAGVSFKDAKMINLRYCDKVCTYKLPCQNEGYTDPNSCGQCRCPKGYGGRYCEMVESTSCGEELVATTSFQTLTSQALYANTNCIWRIKSPAGEKIEVLVDSLNFPCSDSCKTFVEVKSAADKTATGPRLCCTPPRSSFYSEGDDVILILRGDEALQSGYLGFTMRYRKYGSPKITSQTPPVESTPAPTTTTAATTTTATMTTTTFPAVATGSWGVWGRWSECSKPCGGCGRRQRVRGCYGGNGHCNGYSVQTNYCNQQKCEIPAPPAGMCSGRLLLPCDLVEKLQFGSSAAAQPATHKHGRRSCTRTHTAARHPASFYRHPVSRRTTRRGKRAADAPLCEKKFTYKCPTKLLTVRMGYKPAGSTTTSSRSQVGSDGCCDGFYSSGEYCYKK